MFGSQPQLQLHLDRTRNASRDVRLAVQQLAGSGVDVRDVSLAASELVANAVVHTSGAIVVSLWSSSRGHWRIEVADESRALPVIAELAPPEQPGGRGLRMVAALSSDWGVFPTASGKSCWFEANARATPAAARTI